MVGRSETKKGGDAEGDFVALGIVSRSRVDRARSR